MIVACGPVVAHLGGWRGDRLFVARDGAELRPVAELGWDPHTQTTPQRRLHVTAEAIFVLEPADGPLLLPPLRVRRLDFDGRETGREEGADESEAADLYFLAAFANELIERGHVDRERVERGMANFDALARAVAGWTPERQERVTGIPAATLRELVARHAAAPGAALYMATGVNQGRSGTLCFWLLESINAISGNLDRAGGTLMGRGLFDMAKEVTADTREGLVMLAAVVWGCARILGVSGALERPLGMLAGRGVEAASSWQAR